MTRWSLFKMKSPLQLRRIRAWIRDLTSGRNSRAKPREAPARTCRCRRLARLRFLGRMTDKPSVHVAQAPTSAHTPFGGAPAGDPGCETDRRNVRHQPDPCVPWENRAARRWTRRRSARAAETRATMSPHWRAVFPHCLRRMMLPRCGEQFFSIFCDCSCILNRLQS
jgi:hypothetical protein